MFRQHSGGSDKVHFFRSKGCSYCSNTGYHGRIGVMRLLKITPELRRLIVGWATTEELRRLAVAQGMRTMPRGDAARRGRRHHHPRGREDPLHELIPGPMRLTPTSYSGAPGAQSSPPPSTPPAPRSKAPRRPTRSACAGHARRAEPLPDPHRGGAGPARLRADQGRRRKKNLMNFTRQLSVFIKASIPITGALTTIGDETTDVAIRRAIVGMLDDAAAVCSPRVGGPVPERLPRRTTSASSSRRAHRSPRRLTRLTRPVHQP
ncbi:MAG: hypothetical protein R2705_24890 [Ilumatobacteraceae bacterium]